MQIIKCPLAPSPFMAMAMVMAAIVYISLQVGQSEARSASGMRSSDEDDQDAASAVIPSPNQAFDDEVQAGADIMRDTKALLTQQQPQPQQLGRQANEASPVPVYVSQYLIPGAYASQQESSRASVDFASPHQLTGQTYGPSSGVQEERRPSKDLRVAESYGLGHQGHHGSHHGSHYGGHHSGHDEHHGKDHYGKGDHHYDNSGWLNMGAYTGKKGSFGWHADYPVGGNHGHGYGK